jgi:hypothetical protein
LGRATSDFNRYENLYKVVPLLNNNTNANLRKTRSESQVRILQQQEKQQLSKRQ